MIQLARFVMTCCRRPIYLAAIPGTLARLYGGISIHRIRPLSIQTHRPVKSRRCNQLRAAPGADALLLFLRQLLCRRTPGARRTWGVALRGTSRTSTSAPSKVVKRRSVDRRAGWPPWRRAAWPAGGWSAGPSRIHPQHQPWRVYSTRRVFSEVRSCVIVIGLICPPNGFVRIFGLWQ
jgi:hypothetical protein